MISRMVVAAFLFITLLAENVFAESRADGLICPNGCTCIVQGDGVITFCEGLGFSEIPERLSPRNYNLYLQGNTIGEVKESDFNPIPSLRILALTDCGIENLQSGSFSQLKNLTSLDLTDNKIRILRSYIFAGLNKLENVILDGNKIRVIESYAFKGAGSLYDGITLSINDNRRLNELQSHAFQFAKIQQLNIHNGSLSNASLGAIKDLKHSLKMLLLQGNRRPLHFDPDLFQGFDLQALSLERNGITNVDFLQHVTASIISLSYNPIGTVNFSSYDSLKNVRDLLLAGTNCDSVLSANFEGMSTLAELKLSENNIVKLTDEAEALFSRLQRIQLGGNRLHCNCELLWFKKWLRKGFSVVEGAECSTPFQADIRTTDDSIFRCYHPQDVAIRKEVKNGEIHLICSSKGEPVPNLTWKTPEGGKFHYKQRQISGTTFARLELGCNYENGFYSCEARNFKGNKKSTVYVDMYERLIAAQNSASRASCDHFKLVILLMTTFVTIVLICI